MFYYFPLLQGTSPDNKRRHKREIDDSEGIGYTDDIVDNYRFTYDLPNGPNIPGWSSRQAEHAARQLSDGKLNEIRTAFPACEEALKDVTTESCMEDIKVEHNQDSKSF